MIRNRYVNFFLSYLCCGIKGILLPRLLLIPGEQNKEDMFEYQFGINHPEMEKHWEDLYANYGVHELTNIAVEWTRLHPQRAAKFFSAVILVQQTIIIGLLIAMGVILL